MLVKVAEVSPLPSMGGRSVPLLVSTALNSLVASPLGVDATLHLLERVALKPLYQG